MLAHTEVEMNKRVDKAAKEAAERGQTLKDELKKILNIWIPVNKAALVHRKKDNKKKKWTEQWTKLTQKAKLDQFDKTFPCRRQQLAMDNKLKQNNCDLKKIMATEEGLEALATYISVTGRFQSGHQLQTSP